MNLITVKIPRKDNPEKYMIALKKRYTAAGFDVEYRTELPDQKRGYIIVHDGLPFTATLAEKMTQSELSYIVNSGL